MPPLRGCPSHSEGNAGEPLADIAEPARFAEFAVIDDVQIDLGLPGLIGLAWAEAQKAGPS
jgi:hypothetical protein